jgi:hypothetical protein
MKTKETFLLAFAVGCLLAVLGYVGVCIGDTIQNSKCVTLLQPPGCKGIGTLVCQNKGGDNVVGSSCGACSNADTGDASICIVVEANSTCTTTTGTYQCGTASFLGTCQLVDGIYMCNLPTSPNDNEYCQNASYSKCQ